MAIAAELLKIAAQAAVQQFSRQHWPQRFGGALAAVLVASIAGLAALASAVAALGFWVAPKIGAALACVVCMGALLLVSLALLVIARLLIKRRRSRNTENNLAALAYLLDTGGKEMRAAFERHIPSLIVAAVVGGLVTGFRLRGKRRR